MTAAVVHDLRTLADRLRAARSAVRSRWDDLQAIVGEETIDLQKASHRRRARGTADVGIQWHALAERYLRWKRKRGFSPLIGISTGKLLDSLRWRAAGRDVVVEYTDQPKANFFEKGHKPPRPLFPEETDFPRQWTDLLEQAATEWFSDLLVIYLQEKQK